MNTPADGGRTRARKLAERLFLEFRSRRDQAFIEHFTGTFFRVGQYLGNKPIPKTFEKVAAALMRHTDDMKTLTLMALSANSWIPATKRESCKMNLFATVLTYPAPSANYRGESELNRTVIQKITDGRFDYPIISPESMRNALREILKGLQPAMQPRPAPPGVGQG